MEAARKLTLVRDYDTPPQELDDTFTAPLAILRWSQPALAIAYAHLYSQTIAVGKNFVDTNLQQLMRDLNRKDSTIRGYLADLASDRYRAIHVASDDLTGALRITVFRLRAFAPQRPAKCDPKRPLIDEPDIREGGGILDGRILDGSAVSPIEETRGAGMAPTHADDSAGRAAERLDSPPAPRPSSGPRDFDQIPARDFVQNPARDFDQNPASDAAALARLIEAKRAQAVRASPPASAEAPRDFVQNPPRARAPDTNTNTRHFEESASVKTQKRASPKVSSVSAPETSPWRAPGECALGETAEQLAQQWTDPERQRAYRDEVERMVAELIRYGGVTPDGCPLMRTPARKIAMAVAAGWLDWTGDVLRLLDIGAAKTLAEPPQTAAPWVYLVGTMPKLFAERERCWSPSKPKPKPR
ncbi:MAG TPA: hypothetical protein VJ783_25775 [Pirellulales bacterium]|nr:hypothetical protein [Pirellulales bacterium]